MVATLERPGRQARDTYTDKVHAAVRFVEAHLTEPVDLTRVCRHVGVSKFYFSRIFQATLGETVLDYVRRRRLTEIARRLVHSDRPIVELALEYGYESQQSMTKAFRRQFSSTPAQYRREGADRFMFERRPIERGEIERIANLLETPPVVVSLPGLRIVGLREDLPVDDPEPVRGIRERFWRRARELRACRTGEGLYEVTTMGDADRLAFTEQTAFEGLIGFRMPAELAVPRDLSTVEFPPMSYLVFRYRGDNSIESLSKLYRQVFSTGLLRRSETLADGPFFHFYPDDPAPAPRDAEVDIHFYLPIE